VPHSELRISLYRLERKRRKQEERQTKRVIDKKKAKLPEQKTKSRGFNIDTLLQIPSLTRLDNRVYLENLQRAGLLWPQTVTQPMGFIISQNADKQIEETTPTPEQSEDNSEEPETKPEDSQSDRPTQSRSNTPQSENQA